MALFDPDLPLSRKVHRYGLGLIALLLVIAAVSLWMMRTREIADWRQHMGALSLLVAEETAQTMTATRKAMDGISAHVRSLNLQDAQDFKTHLGNRETHEVIRNFISGLGQVELAALIATDGTLININYDHPPPALNLADREHVRIHQDGKHVGDYYGTPILTRTKNQWTFHITRRLENARGQFIGVLSFGISVAHLADFYSKLSGYLGQDATVTLFRNDLTTLVRVPRQDHLMGKINTTGAAYEVIVLQQKEHAILLRDTPRYSTGEPTLRLAAVRRVPGHPLVIAVVVMDNLFMANWWRAATLLPLLSLLGGAALYFGLQALVSNLKKREDDLETMARLTAEAEAANLAKSAFLATMSHEIRTPMNGMLGMAQMLLMPQVDDQERKEYARVILNSGQTLLTLLNDILDLSKVEAGKLTLTPTATDPRQIVEEVAALFQEPALRKGLGLQARCDTPADTRYLADPTRLRQMLANLLSNGIKFTTTGEVGLVVLEISRNEIQATLEFSVSDTGIGIAPEKLDQLFKPFSQVDDSITREFGGTGLGLSIVRSLAERMGGEAGVESQLGHGSRFWFRIQAEVVDPAREARALARATGASRPLQGHRVWVVEDNLSNRAVLSVFLGQLGLEAEIIDNGQEALARLGQGPRPDLILMDIQMPVLDGISATRHLRAWEAEQGLAPVPIIALTAAAFDHDRARCLGAGMDEFLAKPVNLDELSALLEKFLAPATEGKAETGA